MYRNVDFDPVAFGARPLVNALAKLADASVNLRTLPTGSGVDKLSAQIKRPRVPLRL